MGFPLYECPDTLPDRIPEVLGGLGMTITRREARRRDGFPATDTTKAIWDVDRGLVGASILFFCEDGKMGFFITWRRGWSLLLPWLSKRLNRDIEAALFRNGAKNLSLENGGHNGA